MVSRWVFTGFAGLIGLQRLAELGLSKRNEQRIRAAGGIEYGAEQHPWMTALHASWLAAMVGEVWLLNRPFKPGLAIAAAILFGIGQALRYTAILTLGWRWNVRILVVPGYPRIEKGIYRYIRHPNYVGVALEIFSAPLIHTAVMTSLFFSLANAIFLKERIEAEENALSVNSINARSHLFS